MHLKKWTGDGFVLDLKREREGTLKLRFSLREWPKNAKGKYQPR